MVSFYSSSTEVDLTNSTEFDLINKLDDLCADLNRMNNRPGVPANLHNIVGSDVLSACRDTVTEVLDPTSPTYRM